MLFQIEDIVRWVVRLATHTSCAVPKPEFQGDKTQERVLRPVLSSLRVTQCVHLLWSICWRPHCSVLFGGKLKSYLIIVEDVFVQAFYQRLTLTRACQHQHTILLHQATCQLQAAALSCHKDLRRAHPSLSDMLQRGRNDKQLTKGKTSAFVIPP